MRKICLFNQDNNTTLSLNLFSRIAREKRSVLIVDLRLNKERKLEKEKGAFDLLNEDIKPKDCIKSLEPNLDIMVGTHNLNVQEFNSFYKLFKLNYFNDVFRNIDYDYVVLEVSDHLNLIATNALFYSTEVMTILDMDKGAINFLQKLARFTFQYNKIYGKNIFISKAIPKFSEEHKEEIYQYLTSEFTTKMISPSIVDKRNREFEDSLNKIALSIMAIENMFDKKLNQKEKQKAINEYLDLIQET